VRYSEGAARNRRQIYHIDDLKKEMRVYASRLDFVRGETATPTSTESPLN
jgi:hypothetical protein